MQLDLHPTTPPTFSLAERDRRWELARQLMDRAGVDALIVYGDREGTGPAPFAPDTWFTNDRPGSIVVVPRHAEPIAPVMFPMAVADHIEATRRGEQLWIRPENIWVARHADGVVQALREHKLERSTIGVLGLEPYPPYYFTPPLPTRLWHDVTQALPEARFTPVWRQFIMATLRQSDEELAVLACRPGQGRPWPGLCWTPPDQAPARATCTLRSLPPTATRRPLRACC